MSKHNVLKKIKYYVDKFEQKLHDEQHLASSQVYKKPLNIIRGNAGSGKTLVACFTALKFLSEDRISKIVIARPTISTEENGFLPGGIEEKMEPWVQPIYGCMNTIFSVDTLSESDLIESAIKFKLLEIIPLSYMRGRTFTDSFIIIDEAQNLTIDQTMMVISRLGKDSTMVICGDLNQVDLKKKSTSGLQFLEQVSSDKYISNIKLETNHRHEIVDDILEKYNLYQSKKLTQNLVFI